MPDRGDHLQRYRELYRRQVGLKLYYTIGLMLILLALVAVSIWQTEFYDKIFITRTQWNTMVHTIRGLLHPDTSSFGFWLAKMWETVQMALIGTLIAVAISLPLSFFGAKNLRFSILPRPLPSLSPYHFTRMLFNLVRAVPDFVVALLLVRVTGLGPTTGILALGIHSIGMLGKLFSEAIEAVDEGPLEAVTACGGTRWQVIMYGVMPQVSPYFTGYSLYRWDINVRSGVVLGLVGAGGIGFDFMDAVNNYRWEKASMAIVVILVTITAFDLFSSALRNRTD